MKLRILCILLALTLLCGCSAVGTYQFERLEAGGKVYDAASVDDPDSCYISLWKDGTGVLSIFGNAMVIEWENDRLWPDGKPNDTVPFLLEGNTLTLEYEGQKLVFCK